MRCQEKKKKTIDEAILIFLVTLSRSSPERVTERSEGDNEITAKPNTKSSQCGQEIPQFTGVSRTGTTRSCLFVGLPEAYYLFSLFSVLLILCSSFFQAELLPGMTLDIFLLFYDFDAVTSCQLQTPIASPHSVSCARDSCTPQLSPAVSRFPDGCPWHGVKKILP